MTVTVKEKLTLELMNEYSPVYPLEQQDWTATAAYLYGEEPELMAELTASLKANGWREPLTISDDDASEKFVLNGTHRAVIALREGVVSVPVIFESEVQSYWADESDALVMAKIECKTGALSEEEDDKLITTLRSFELSKELWITSSVAYGSGALLEIPFDTSDESIIVPLKTKLRKLLKKVFPDYSFKITVELEALDSQ